MAPLCRRSGPNGDSLHGERHGSARISDCIRGRCPKDGTNVVPEGGLRLSRRWIHVVAQTAKAKETPAREDSRSGPVRSGRRKGLPTTIQGNTRGLICFETLCFLLQFLH